MIRQLAVAVSCVSIAACASSGPENSTPLPQAQATSASAQPIATDAGSEKPAENGDALEMVDAPAVPVEDEAQATTASSRHELVCRRTKVTGSHMVTRICRTRAQIDAEAEASREALDRMRSQQSTNALPRQSMQRDMPRTQPGRQ